MRNDFRLLADDVRSGELRLVRATTRRLWVGARRLVARQRLRAELVGVRAGTPEVGGSAASRPSGGGTRPTGLCAGAPRAPHIPHSAGRTAAQRGRLDGRRRDVGAGDLAGDDLRLEAGVAGDAWVGARHEVAGHAAGGSSVACSTSRCGEAGAALIHGTVRSASVRASADVLP